jgi:hypothetical protein
MMMNKRKKLLLFVGHKDGLVVCLNSAEQMHCDLKKDYLTCTKTQRTEKRKNLD